MKTPEEIKESMRQCYGWLEGTGRCDKCQYNDLDLYACGRKLTGDALAYIEQLEERIDLMMIQMRGDCGCCKHRNAKEEPCRSCLNEEDSPYWQYEGLPVIKL